MRTFLLSLLFALLGLLPAASAAPAYDPTHAAWSRLLTAHVQWNATGTTTTVDYEGFRRDASALDEYLRSLATVSEARFRQFGKAEREAFLINVYNAATVQLILTRPGVGSIKELGGLVTTPWQKRFVNLLGGMRTLDEIEHDMLRGATDYSDPRVHFAVNCASIGCPALRPEAYVGARLHEQLEDQTRRFLGDRTRNRHDERSGVLWVSKIFDWYAADFEKHSGGVQAFLAGYPGPLRLESTARDRLRSGLMPVQYREYDWRLNRRRP